MVRPFDACLAATITLFDVVPTSIDPAYTGPSISEPPQNTTVSAIGKGTDGLTTYREEIIATDIVYVEWQGDDTTTTTATVATDYTVTAIIAEDATHKWIHQDIPTAAPHPLNQFGWEKDCDLDGKGGAECVNRGWEAVYGPDGNVDSTMTVTTTMTGSIIPLYTLVVQSNSAWLVIAPGIPVASLIVIASILLGSTLVLY
ncbi:hypothetical protein H0H92_000402 [Tricholoma furcatifolium]|nr:hypothetical protein H0H92_000402 [Tricholoma furcatifolium]